MEQVWILAKDFFQHRTEIDWSPKSKSEKQMLFSELGLTSEFWKL